MAVTIKTLEQAQTIKKAYTDRGMSMPANLQKAIAEFESKAANQTMSSDKAKEILKKDPTNAAAQEAVNIANAGYEKKEVPHVTEYTDPTEGGKYKFNWQQYAFRDNPELANARALTPEQIDEIDKARLESMHEVTDKVNLDNIATNMHFKMANEKWSDFMKSDRFAQFKNYMDDVQQYQQDKALDNIWNDGSIANIVTDFTLPVSKTYAREHYNDINGASDMAAPLVADAAMNAAMASSSKIAAPLARFIGPTKTNFAANAVAPVIGEVGQVLVNDKDLTSAARDAAIGTGANYAVPNILRALNSKFTRNVNTAMNKPWMTNAQDALDAAVNEAKAARAAQNNVLTKNAKTGHVFDNKNKIEYVDPDIAAVATEHPLAHEGWRYESNLKQPNKQVNIVTEDRSYIFQPEAEARDAANMNLKDVAGLNNKAKAAASNIKNILTRNKAVPNKGYAPKARSEEFYSMMPEEMRAAFREQDERAAKTFWDRVNKIHEGKISAADWQDNYNATQAAYQYLGIQPRESLVNYLSRQKGPTIEYLSNLYGTSPRAKRYFSNMRYMLPDGIYNAEEAKKQEEQEQQAATYRLLLNRR